MSFTNQFIDRIAVGGGDGEGYKKFSEVVSSMYILEATSLNSSIDYKKTLTYVKKTAFQA